METKGQSSVQAESILRQSPVRMAHLKLLGGAIIEDEFGVVTGLVSRRHPLALLALLATAPSRTMSRGKLIGLLWPEALEEKGRNRLSTYVHQIRSGLGEDVLVSVGHDLRLDPLAITCDVCRFEEALEVGDHQRAVELYEGPFLDGFRLGGSSAFEHRVDLEQARLRRAYHEALEALAEEAEERDELQGAVRWWRERASADPYDSRVTQCLMEVLAKAGNGAAALRTARVHAQLLESEFGTKPSAEVRALVERLRRNRTEATASPGAVAPVTAGDPGRRESFESVDSSHSAEPKEPPPQAPGRSTGAAPRRLGAPHRRLLWAAVAVVAVGAAAIWMWAGGNGASLGAERPTVAVLPFQALGGDRRDPVTEGLHSDLLTRLSNIASLKVISGMSVQRYREAGIPTSEIARELGARWVLEGSVQQAGGQIQVNAQLIDSRTDSHIWAQTYRRDLTAANLFDMQDEITVAIAGALKARITPAEVERLTRAPTRDLEAYRHYVRGRQHLESRTEVGLGRAVELFGRVIERDSSFALAWAGLADAVGLYRTYGYTPPVDLLDQEVAARRALEIDPELAEAHAALGYVQIVAQNAPAALRSLERAVEIKPSYAQGHHWLGYLLALGPLDRAFEHVSLAVELNPALAPAYGTLAWIHLSMGEPREALAEARRARQRLPERSGPYSRALRNEAFALYHMGRFAEIDSLSREAASSAEEPLPAHRALAAMVALATGDTARAREGLSRLKEEGSPPAMAAWVHAALGEPDAALAAFREQSAWGIGGVLFLRCGFPDAVGRLQAEPRYEELLRHAYRSWRLEPPTRSLEGGTACSTGGPLVLHGA